MRFHYSMGVEHYLAVVELTLASGLAELAQLHDLLWVDLSTLLCLVVVLVVVELRDSPGLHGAEDELAQSLALNLVEF